MSMSQVLRIYQLSHKPLRKTTVAILLTFSRDFQQRNAMPPGPNCGGLVLSYGAAKAHICQTAINDIKVQPSTNPMLDSHYAALPLNAKSTVRKFV